ncbi:MAG: sugar kinase [Anaerolineae bacterium]
MKFDVIGLGVSTLDVITLVEHFPAQDEVQRALAVAVQGGGPVATAMVTLARLGARVAMLDHLGDDWRAELIHQEFLREGVCTEYLKVSEGFTSSIATVLVRRADGARAIAYAPGTTPELSGSDVPEDLLASASILHLNGRHWEACIQASRYARQNQVLVSFDGGAHRYRPQLRDLIPLTDICIVARHFASQYTGETEIAGAARGLLREGPGLVVITDGTRGSWVYPAQGHSFHQPAYLVPDVVDTTGCGDSYHGAFLFGLVKGLSLEQTAALASAVAALNSRGLGGRSALPSLGQAIAFLSERGVTLPSL